MPSCLRSSPVNGRNASPSLPLDSGPPLLAGLVIAVVTIVIGGAWLYLAPESVRQDLQHSGSEQLGWPRDPLVAAALLLALLGIAAAWPASGERVPRLGACATSVCLALALAQLTTCLVARAAATANENTLASAFERGALETIAGPEADRQLDALRAWNP